APDSLMGPELHKRAFEVVQSGYEDPMQKALQSFERLGGSDRVATKPAAVVKAAAESRVGHLFLAEGARLKGNWDKNEMRVTKEGEGEDLLNIALLQTLAHGGEAWVIAPEHVPGGGPVAALLRF